MFGGRYRRNKHLEEEVTHIQEKVGELEKELIKRRPRNPFVSKNIINMYAGENIYLVQLELSACLSCDDWYTLQNQPFYAQLIQYLDDLEIQCRRSETREVRK